MFLCFLSFCGLSSPDCIGFGVYWSVCFRFFFGCPAHSSPKLLEGISSLQILEGLFPKKSWRDYPVHTSQKTAGTIQSTLPPKNPGRTIQSTVPKKTLEGLSSPQFPKKPCRDYPVHTSQKNPAGTIQSTLPPKNPGGTIQSTLPPKNPGGTIQSTVPKKTLQGLSSPHFPKKPCRDYPVHTSQKKSWRNYPVHSFQKKILMLFHHLQA